MDSPPPTLRRTNSVSQTKSKELKKKEKDNTDKDRQNEEGDEEGGMSFLDFLKTTPPPPSSPKSQSRDEKGKSDHSRKSGYKEKDKVKEKEKEIDAPKRIDRAKSFLEFLAEPPTLRISKRRSAHQSTLGTFDHLPFFFHELNSSSFAYCCIVVCKVDFPDRY